MSKVPVRLFILNGSVDATSPHRLNRFGWVHTLASVHNIILTEAAHYYHCWPMQSAKARHSKELSLCVAKVPKVYPKSPQLLAPSYPLRIHSLSQTRLQALPPPLTELPPVRVACRPLGLRLCRKPIIPHYLRPNHLKNGNDRTGMIGRPTCGGAPNGPKRVGLRLPVLGPVVDQLLFQIPHKGFNSGSSGLAHKRLSGRKAFR